MASRTLRTVAFVAFAALAPILGWAAKEQTGEFALYRGTPHIASHVQLVDHNELDIVQNAPGSKSPILRYADTEHEPIHVILVRDDFRSFSHVHPSEAGDGHFHMRVALTAGHRYYAFVGSRPAGYSPQVFRFVLQAGAPPHHVVTTLVPQSRTIAGPYVVSLSTGRVSAGRPATIVVDVASKNGSAVQVTPFRGAAAHTVFVNPQTLQYVHVDAAQTGNRIALHVPPLQHGAYRMWLEFDNGRSIFTAPFILAAQ